MRSFRSQSVCSALAVTVALPRRTRFDRRSPDAAPKPLSQYLIITANWAPPSLEATRMWSTKQESFQVRIANSGTVGC